MLCDKTANESVKGTYRDQYAQHAEYIHTKVEKKSCAKAKHSVTPFRTIKKKKSVLNFKRSYLPSQQPLVILLE